GKIPYRANVEIFHRNKPKSSINHDSDEPVAKVVIDTDLEGVAVDLPVPYGKAPEQKRPLQVTLQLNQQTALVEVDYGHPNDLETEPTKGKISGDQNAVTEPEKIPDYAVHALLRLQRSTNQLLNTNIALANRA